MEKQFLVRNRHFQTLFDRPDLAWMGQNTNHLPTPPEVKQAMLECIEKEEYHKYPPPLGIEELRSLILKDLGVGDGTVWVTSGGVEGIHEVARTYIRPGDDFVTTDPGWNVFNKFARYFGANVIDVPIYGQEWSYRLSPERLKEHVTKKTRMIYIVDPNNPLGSSYSEDEIKAFCEIAEDTGAMFVQDCTYRDFSDRNFPALRFRHENTVVGYSFSKGSGLAGMRIGAIVSSEEVIEKLTEAQVNNFGVNVIAQRAAIAALKSKGRWAREQLGVVRTHQEHVKESVDKTQGAFIAVYPSDSNFVAVDVKGTGCSPEQIVCKLLEDGIFVRHAGYQSRRFADRFIKVSVTVPPEDIARFCEHFPRVADRVRREGVDLRALF